MKAFTRFDKKIHFYQKTENGCVEITSKEFDEYDKRYDFDYVIVMSKFVKIIQDEPKKKSHIRKYRCPVCGCSVRASKEVSIACLDCNARMLLDTPQEELTD